MHSFDYNNEIEKTKRRIEWLRIQITESQHHECYDITEQLKSRLEKTERDLERLVSLR